MSASIKNMLSIIGKFTIIMSFFLFLFACEKSGPPSINRSSSDFSTIEEKIAFLKQYVPFKWSCSDVDFLIWYQNNSGGMVPGPSDWDIRIVAKVPENELPKSIPGFAKTNATPDFAWANEIATSIDYTGEFEWFQSGNAFVGVNKSKSVILYCDSTM